MHPIENIRRQKLTRPSTIDRMASGKIALKAIGSLVPINRKMILIIIHPTERRVAGAIVMNIS